MKRILCLGAAFLALATESAHAARFVALVQPVQILHLAVFGLSIACMVGSFHVLSLVRGGMLAKSWQLFLAGFVILGISQLLALFNGIEIIATPTFVLPLMYGCMAGLFLYGIFETRRTLS